MTTYKNRLPPSALMGYISPAPHKTGAGFRTPQINKAHNRASGFFTCDALPHLFRIMAGRTGQPKGWPGSLLTGSANPVRLTTPEFRTSDGELSQLTNKGYPSWQTVNHVLAACLLTFSQSICASTVSTRWRCICKSNFHRQIARSRLCVFRQFSAIWQTTLTKLSGLSTTVRNNPQLRPWHSGAFTHPCKTEGCP
ncbi:TPA: ash family protein [Salmonella enterica subsp. salamae]|nr:ash family protein [Salmonella enterica subsp. salamae]